MKKHNITKLLMGAATVTIATMLANGDAEAGELKTNEKSYQAPVIHHSQQKEVSDTQRAYYHILHLDGISNQQRQQYLDQLRKNPTDQTAQNVFSESIKDRNNPERRVGQHNAFYEILHNQRLSNTDRNHFLQQLKENPDRSQQIWIDSHRAISQNKDNSASAKDFNKFTTTPSIDISKAPSLPKYESNQNHYVSQNRDNTATEEEFNKLIGANPIKIGPNIHSPHQDINQLIANDAIDVTGHQASQTQQRHLPSKNQYNTATEDEFRKFTSSPNTLNLNGKKESKEDILNLLLGPNGHTITPYQLDQLFPPIAVNRAKHGKHRFQNAINYPLFDEHSRLLDKLLGPNGHKITSQELDKLFPPIAVNRAKHGNHQFQNAINYLHFDERSRLLNKLLGPNGHKITSQELDKLFPPIPVNKMKHGKHHYQHAINYPLFDEHSRLLDKLHGPHGHKITSEELDKLFPPIPVTQAAQKTHAHGGQTKVDLSQKHHHTHAHHNTVRPSVSPSSHSKIENKGTQTKVSTTVKTKEKSTFYRYYQSFKHYVSQSYHKMTNTYSSFKQTQTSYYAQTFYKYQQTISKFFSSMMK